MAIEDKDTDEGGENDKGHEIAEDGADPFVGVVFGSNGGKEANGEGAGAGEDVEEDIGAVEGLHNVFLCKEKVV